MQPISNAALAATISSFNFQEIKSSFGVLNVSVKYRKDFTPPQVSHVRQSRPK